MTTTRYELTDLGRTEIGAEPEKKTCAETGKTIFGSPGAARSMVRTIRRRSDERLHEYRCEHCRKWHVGHGLKQRNQ